MAQWGITTMKAGQHRVECIKQGQPSIPPVRVQLCQRIAMIIPWNKVSLGKPKRKTQCNTQPKIGWVKV